MLIEFSVRNFRSIKERVTLSMVAAKLTSKDKRLDQNVVVEAPGKLRLLTSAVLYGANASGKSNVVKAMDFMRRFVLDSAKETRPRGGISAEPFLLSAETEHEPSEVEILFLSEGRQYRYGFQVDHEEVRREWLYTLGPTKERRLFEREVSEIHRGPGFSEGKGLAERTRPNALFLSVAAQFNGPVSQQILAWFAQSFNVISGLDDEAQIAYTFGGLEDAALRETIVRFVRNLDIGINDLRLVERPLDIAGLVHDAYFDIRSAPEKGLAGSGSGEFLEVRVETMHDKFGSQHQLLGQTTLDLGKNESEGTRKLFSLAGLLLGALGSGDVIVADEFDARLHPIITRALIELFNNRDTNPNHAQLILTTQDTSLLDNRLFRRDQIWFTEKDQEGATDLYSLAEIKGIRNDATYEKDYVQGRYGAIPFLGDFRRLLGVSDVGSFKNRLTSSGR